MSQPESGRETEPTLKKRKTDELFSPQLCQFFKLEGVPRAGSVLFGGTT